VDDLHHHCQGASGNSFGAGWRFAKVFLASKEGLNMTKVIGIISAAGGKSGMMDLYGALTLRRDATPDMSLFRGETTHAQEI
jgi:hypothetical protein